MGSRVGSYVTAWSWCLGFSVLPDLYHCQYSFLDCVVSTLIVLHRQNMF